MKKTFTILIVLVLLLGGAAWYFVTFRMDAMIEQKIESAASTSLGSQVSVGKVTTDIKGGSLEISSVTVANPPGFRNETAFSLNGIEAALDYATLDIKRVVIDKPEIVIEEMGGRTNFDQMMQALNSQSSQAGSESAPDAGADGGEETIIVVRHFRMNESRASFESESLDRYSNLEIDAVELNDLRGTPEEVGKIIANQILKEVTQEAATELLKAQARKKYDEAEIKVTRKLKDLLGGDDKDDSGN